MSINYALYENHLTTDPADFAALVEITASADSEAVADRMIQQGSTVTKPDILAVIEDLVGATESLLLEGYRVNMAGLFEMFPRIKGIFNGAADTFDPSRHHIDVGANPGSRVRDDVRANASVVKQETILPAPHLLEYVDLGSGETNDEVTPGSIGTINGHRLKFDAAQADEGIYFIHAGTAAETKVTDVQKNKPGQLVFLVPTLASAPYYLEVRAQFSKAGPVRAGRLDAQLTVFP